MTIFQLLMLGASAFFAYKIYEHIQTLQDPKEGSDNTKANAPQRTAAAFSTFDASSLVEKADEAREINELDKALAIYSEANIKEPKNAEVLFKMGYTLAQQERYEEAVEYFLESIEVDDENPFAYKELSLSYEKLGELQKAQEFYNKAKAIDEDI
jgi:tetratricopeptide (TPR) repeat protein